jgi:hypothetical protein
VSRPALGPTQSPVQWVPGVLSPAVKARPGREADHSPRLSLQVLLFVRCHYIRTLSTVSDECRISVVDRLCEINSDDLQQFLLRMQLIFKRNVRYSCVGS